jgi:hypothetical protein
MSRTCVQTGAFAGLFALLCAVFPGSIEPAMADQMPKFDVEANCRAAAARARNSEYVAVCMQEERDARSKIEQSWSQFKPPDKEHCVQLSRLGGQPTFTELLTCLELARDVRVLHSESPPEMTTPASNRRGRGAPAPASVH